MFVLSSRRRHTSFALVTGVQTCALPISERPSGFFPEPCRYSHIRLQFPFLERERLLRRGSRVEAVASYLELGGRGTVLLAVSPALDAAMDSSPAVDARSEEHTSELQSLMRISYAVFCLKKKKQSKK